jgi:hypothetical protein
MPTRIHLHRKEMSAYAYTSPQEGNESYAQQRVKLSICVTTITLLYSCDRICALILAIARTQPNNG